MTTEEEIDTTNWGLVGLSGNNPIVSLRHHLRLSKAEALNLAAYLAIMADDNDGAFDKLRTAIERA